MAMPAQQEAEELGADRPVRLAAPSLKGVVRIVAIVVACAAMVYLAWRLRGAVRPVGIYLFLAFAAAAGRGAISAHYRPRRRPV